MWKKCTKHLHALLHRNVDYLSQRKSEKEDGKKETHVAALSVSEQVLLMTSKVKVFAADGSSTIARALIDPGSSLLFVHERLAQHLRLLCSNKNAKWKELLELVHLQEVLYGPRCLALRTMGQYLLLCISTNKVQPLQCNLE